jgi:hypothetical protein
MRRAPKRRWLLGTMAAGLAAAAPVGGAPCVGFTDVDSSSGFCPNVEWLKNRAITTGCTSVSLYCPAEIVTRLSMSAFLQRLGNALTPTLISGYNSGSFLDIDPQPVICPTALHTPAFPRTAHGTGMVLAWTAAAVSMDVDVTLVGRSGGSGPWNPVAGGVPGSFSVQGNGMYKSAVVLLPPQPLTPGTGYEWGLRVGRRSGSATAGDFAGWNCQIHVESENRIAGSSPFDQEAAGSVGDEAR